MALKILLVDDETVFRTCIREMKFWETGEFVLSGEAGSGDEALAVLAEREIDLVLMDVSMPGKNGIVLSEIISRKYPGTAIIAMSSYDDYDYVREILKNGAYDYILKSRLSEEFLVLTLKNIATRLKGRSSWEIKAELRRQTREWIFGEGSTPSPLITAERLRLSSGSRIWTGRPCLMTAVCWRASQRRRRRPGWRA